MQKKILIFPYNGNGVEALDCLTDEYECIGYIDDMPEKQGKLSNGLIVFTREALNNYTEALVLAIPGSPASYPLRKAHINSLSIEPERFATIIHPKAVVAASVKLGYNVLLMAGTVLTSNATIGNHVCILPNAVVHHDTKIGDYSIVGSQVVVAGNTIIEDNCYIGSGSAIINNITVGQGALVGMGSVVIRQVKPHTRVAGNPARVL